MSHFVAPVGSTLTAKWSVVTVYASAADAVVAKGATSAATKSAPAATRLSERDRRMVLPANTKGVLNAPPLTPQRPSVRQVTLCCRRKVNMFYFGA